MGFIGDFGYIFLDGSEENLYSQDKKALFSTCSGLITPNVSVFKCSATLRVFA